MSKTKEKILEKALEQFNAQGTEVVTTRHVAAALDISQGNLHYHFPNKNELILALYRQFADRLPGAQRFRGAAIGMEDILLSMIDHFDLMYRYRFFFVDRDVVWRRLPRLEREAKVFIWRTRRRLLRLIALLQHLGLFRRDFSTAQIEAFVDVQLVLVNSWLQAAPLFGVPEGVTVAEFFALRFFRAWLPYLVEGERVDWERKL